MNKGFISQILGVVVDVEFPQKLPAILNALTIKLGNGEILTLEVQQQINEKTVRCITLGQTEGLSRGLEVVDTGKALHVPVGKEVLGRMLNVVGDPIDGKPAIESEISLPIHRDPPYFKSQTTKSEILETGIKVIDLLCPFLKGGKVGLFGGGWSW